MLDAIAIFIGSVTGLSSAGVLAVFGGIVAAIVGAVYVKGRGDAKTKRADDALNRVDAGRRAVGDSRATEQTPDERVRRNDGAWQ